MKNTSRTCFKFAASREPRVSIRHRRPHFEALEDRHLLSGSPVPVGYVPAQIIQAYGVAQIPMIAGQLPGAGQTIALIETSDNAGFLNSTDPSFSTSDLAKFDQITNLADPPSFTVLSFDPNTWQVGARLAPTGGGGEFAMDVEWAHAIAPGASIVVVEVGSSDTGSLAKTMQFAAGLPGVSVVSASLGTAEFADEINLDQYFTTPAGHQSVTFLASSGDGDTVYNPLTPAMSPNVVAVGATNLTLNPSTGDYQSETAWHKSQGGTSQYEAKPAYQNNVNTTSFRQTPDVAAVGAPASGVAVYNTQANGSAGWASDASGGTSLAAPIWAGFIAIANQLRVNAGMGTLDGATQTLPRLYQLSSSDFHSITAVDSGTPATGDPRSTDLSAGGYNLFTGLGSPIANLLVPDLASVSPTIGGVVVVPTQGLMTWNALDSAGMASSSLTVDGAAVSNIQGPYTAASGVNYAGVFGPLSTGTHSYTITGTDTTGYSSQYAGTFSVTGPTISGVVVVPTQGLMTWNAQGSQGVASSSLTVDGAAVSNIQGPYTAAAGVNYAGVFGPLSAGSHNYTITASDTFGNSSQYTGTFNVAAPTIGGVVVVTEQGLMTWNAQGSCGVASSSLIVDGIAVSNIQGPYAAAAGVNYAGVFGTLSAGTHDYTITASDTFGNSSQYTGTFSVAAPLVDVSVDDGSHAARRVDLLTTVMHETDHVLDNDDAADDLLSGMLPLGIRHALAVDHALAAIYA